MVNQQNSPDNHPSWSYPAPGYDADSPTWGEILNALIEDDLDRAVVIKDTFANRPAAGEEGRWFLATDRKIVFYDDGATWEAVAGKGTQANPVPGTSYFEAVSTESATVGSESDSPVVSNDRVSSELAVQPSAGDNAGSIIVFPSGTEGRSHVLLPVDSDKDNFGFLELEANGTRAWIDASRKGSGGTSITDFEFRNLNYSFTSGDVGLDTAVSAAPIQRTISSGAINNAAMHMSVAGESGNDTLTDINVTEAGDLVILRRRNSDDITVAHGTGNIRLDSSTDFVMDTDAARIMLQYDERNSLWYEISSAKP